MNATDCQFTRGLNIPKKAEIGRCLCEQSLEDLWLRWKRLQF